MGSLGNPGVVVVVFDFDKTIIDCDSDNWVVDGLGATATFEAFLQAMPWNLAMDRMMCEVHSQGRPASDIADLLRKAPLDPHVAGAIKEAFSLGCDLRVVSDANRFFITTVLEHHGLLGCFTEINTNPGHVDADGRVRIAPYHDFVRDLHGCPLASCPPNMCKGRIIERIKAEVGSGATFVYLGDGKGDFCPSLKLSEKDFVMPRKGYPLWELIQTRGGGGAEELVVKAEVREWSTWVEQLETLLHIINKASSAHADCPAATVGVIPTDCSIRSAPAVMPLTASHT